MARKRRHEEYENHERWLVSYADFITLLFALFVVMYSISSVNDGKYRVLSETLTDAFITSARSLDPIQVGEEVRTIVPVAGEYAASELGAPESSQQEALPDAVGEHVVASKTQPQANLAGTEADLKATLAPFIANELISVTRTDRGVEVEMKSKMLFTSGSARLSRTAIKLLRDVAGILKSLPNDIVVEGHTDNVPIRTMLFPSNWELSAARAASVVHLLGRFKMKQDRMAAIGYGEHRPTTDNGSAKGRQKNRRVALIIKTLNNQHQSGQIDGFSGRGVQ